MQTQKLRAKLDGSLDSICLECLLTVTEGSNEGHTQVTDAHECPPELLTQSRGAVDAGPLSLSSNLSYNFRINGRLLISKDRESYKVCALTPKLHPRSWIKIYETKAQCLDELTHVEIVSPLEIAATLATDLDENIAILVPETDIDPAVLRAAGFVEQSPEYVK